MGDEKVDAQSLYETFQPKIVRYLARFVGEDEAEDLAQEVFIKVSQGLDRFRGESQLSTWIYRIATNAALDQLRSPSLKLTAVTTESCRSMEETRTVAVRPLVPASETAPSVDQQFSRTQTAKCIRTAVRRLPDNYRSVIVLSELEGLKNREIAEVLGLTLDTVKVRLHRARARLKKDIQEHCHVYHDEYNELTCEVRRAFGEIPEKSGVSFFTPAPSKGLERRAPAMKPDNKLEELIAVGASVAANCQACLEFHVGKALEAGVSQDEIVAAVEVGRKVRSGAAAKMDKFAPSVIKGTPVKLAASEGCGT